MKRLGCALLALGAVFACGKRETTYQGDPPGFSSDAPDSSAPVTPPTTCEGTRRCSRDFRKVVDGCDDSIVLEECPADQGCGQGQCVPACAAAADSTMGCEFVALPPPREFLFVGSCFAAVLANTWGIPARIEAFYGNDALDVKAATRIVHTDGQTTTYEPFDGELKPGELAAVFLSEDPTGAFSVRCPVGTSAAIRKDTAANGNRRSSVFRITTTAPVSAYSFYPFGGGNDGNATATLLVPRASWKTDYLVTSAWHVRHYGINSIYYPTMHLVAAEDDTEITLLGSVNIQGGGEIPGAPKGTPTIYRLGRGEQIQFSQLEDLLGTRVGANKPINVWVGHEGMAIPEDGTNAGDSSQTALFPVRSWGTEYAVVPHRSRRPKDLPEDYLHRITGAVDDTVLTYDPIAPVGAPTTISAGESVTFWTQEPFVVNSQDREHPFAAYSYMTGAQYAVPGGDNGDPEFMTVIPTEQYLGRYVFWIDPIYANAHLVVVRVRDDGKDFKPVTLDCAGELDDWKPIGTSGKYEYTRPWIKNKGTPQKYANGTCNGGRREMTSDGPFAVTVWSTGSFSSYGYPGGAGLRELNAVESINIK